MVKTEQLQSPGPGSAVSGDQRMWIDLEMARRIGMHIGCRLRHRDPVPLPEQQAAAFARVGALRFCDQCGYRATCHHQVHPHLTSNE